jgi:hypothetical protein
LLSSVKKEDKDGKGQDGEHGIGEKINLKSTCTQLQEKNSSHQGCLNLKIPPPTGKNEKI